MANDTSVKWRTRHTLGIVFILVGIASIGLSPWILQSDQRNPYVHNVVTWLLIVSLLIWSFVIIGYGKVGRPTGIIIDGRNQMSLSRLQAAVWTVLVLSAILTIAMFYVRIGIFCPEGEDDKTDPKSHCSDKADKTGTGIFYWINRDQTNRNPKPIPNDTSLAFNAFDITVPPEIWSLLGISTASLAAAGIIKTQKKNEPSNEDTVKTVFNQERAASIDDATLVRQGSSVGYASPADAKFVDFFTGDEVGSANHIELGKLQMFFFTVIVVSAYAVTLAATFGTTTILTDLPGVNGGIVAFLAISHAGYLTNKAVPSTPSGASTVSVQGDYVALLSDGHTRVALSTDGQQMIAYACDGGDSYSPTFAPWFQGSVNNNNVDLNSTTGDRLQATLSPQNATGTITLKGGTPLDFTAEPLTGADNSAGSGLYRSQVILSGASYLAGWIVDKPSPGDARAQGGAILNQQTQELIAAPQLTDADIASKQVVDPNLGTFPLTKCQQGTCS